ncbi:MAG: hypothetical protein HN613_00975 [Gammaproteobacteria bacterium]|jgi:outer membrane biogenesis lipoprotein LolB|nr:hypothetical protein [Gammaproteobacteria bacterium]MBT7603103.1 hypothetical protein [Gammaproteobacteria bacterium]
MKNTIIILFFSILLLCGCSNNKYYEIKRSDSKQEVALKNFLVNGIIKFYADDKKISSRINFIKNDKVNIIEFLDLFNNTVVSFQIISGNIEIKEWKKNVDFKALEEVINKPIFKNIILNLSNILTNNINDKTSFTKYKNNMYKNIETSTYKVHYKRYKIYNGKIVPVDMDISFSNIKFNFKVNNWEFN